MGEMWAKCGRGLLTGQILHIFQVLYFYTCFYCTTP